MQTIKILGMTFSVITEPDFPDFGHTDYDDKKIKLSANLVDGDFRHKLLHELIHIVAMKFNLPIGNCGSYDADGVWIESAEQTLNHMQIDLIAYGLHEHFYP